MDIVGLWGQTVKDAVKRYANKQPRDVREEYEQECLVEVIQLQDVLKKLTDEQGAVTAKNYVYGVCRKCIVDLLKETDRNTYQSFDDPGVAHKIREYEAGELPDYGVSEQDLDAAVKELPRTEQHVIRSLYFNGMTEESLAKSVNETKWWVQQTKKTAIQLLKEILESK